MPKTIEIPCTGYSVMADWYEGKSTDKIILCLTGYNSDRKRYSEWWSGIVDDTGMSLLVFDYSGQGDSPFKLEDIRAAQNFLEVIFAFDWLKQKYPKAHIYVNGSSYGGYLATQLTKYRAFDKLILRAPGIYRPEDFYTLDKNIDRGAALHAFRSDEKALTSHPLLARAAKFKGKTLVMVHEHDEVVPQQTTDAYIRAFNAETYVVKDFLHGLSNVSHDKLAAYHQKISDWLKQE